MRPLAPILAAALSSLVFLACDSAPISPAREMASALPARAILNTRESDVSIGPFPGCNGDVITGTATSHTLDASRSDGAGGLHLNVKQQFDNIRMTGSPSGASYVGSWVETTNVYVSPSDVLTGVVQRHFTINLIGQGQTPNLMLEGVLRIVISANGVERVFTDTFRAVCH